MATVSPPLASNDRPVDAAFIAFYTAAQIGVYVAFVPLLTLLLPLKATAIDPAGSARLLGQVALCGASAAGLANIVVGVLGDRTRHWIGGRALWMVLGLVATIVSYILIYLADQPWILITAVILLQVGINLMLNPLAATLPERVPDRQKGLVAGFVGLAFPLSSLFAALAIGVWLTGELARLTAVTLATCVLVIPFILANWRRPVAIEACYAVSLSFRALKDRDFFIAFFSRLMVQTCVAINVLYLFLFLGSQTKLTVALPGLRPEMVMGGLLTVSTVLAVVSGLVGGRASDRISRRKIMVCSGALLLVVASVTMVSASAWPGPLFAQALFGVGVGLYGITDAALVAEVLPEPEHAGRDMGIMNIAVTTAQMIAPVIGLIAIRSFGGDLRPVYLMGAMMAFVGGIVVLAIQRVR